MSDPVVEWWKRLPTLVQTLMIVVSMTFTIFVVTAVIQWRAHDVSTDPGGTQTGVCVHDSNGEPVLVLDDNTTEHGFGARLDGCR